MLGHRGSACTIVCLLATLANGPCNVQPQRVTATATVSGLDGLSHSTSETFTLSHNPGQATEPRVVTRRIVIPQVKDYSVRVTRTGIPFDESFMLMNISTLGFAPGGGGPPVIASGDLSYIADHVGRIVSTTVDTGRVDSTLSAERHDVFPTRQRTGYVLFARWNKKDLCMPFSDAAATIDVSRFLSAIFNALSTSVTNSDADNDLFSLGGPSNDGNFEMFLVPHTQHSRFVDFNMPWNGFTLIFKATIKAALVSADVWVPFSVLFVRTPSANGNTFLDTRIDLIDLGADSDDRKRLSVTAEGGFPTATANLIREKLLDSLTNMKPENRQAIITAIALFAAALNSLRPNLGQSVTPEDARVVMFPNATESVPRNLVAPGGSLQPTLCILMSTP